MLRLYNYHESGNAYKVRLLLALLEQPFERVDLDILNGETRTDAFLAKNPNHRIPLLEWPDGRRLAESNAMLFYLARDTDYLPADPWLQAQILQWQGFEQYSHEPNIAVVRFWHFADLVEENRAMLDAKTKAGYDALDVMEQHLASRDFFVGERYTIADMSLYAYTHVAEEGKFDLVAYPNIQAWLKRVVSQPRHIAITDEVGTRVAWP